MSEFINLIKLSVGSESVETLAAWQTHVRGKWPDNLPRHITRMWPKQEKALLNGGSLYWVIKGQVLCRQKVLKLEEVIGEDGIRRCAIVLDPEIMRTHPAPRRPFQGWRYLKPDDAPPDLRAGEQGEAAEIPADLSAALAEIGVI